VGVADLEDSCGWEGVLPLCEREVSSELVGGGFRFVDIRIVR
jgi:hypothetical protein